jgi:hypothetical protein
VARYVGGAVMHPLAVDDWAARAALRRVCPARAECLAYTLAADEPDGIWGGLTRNERQRLTRLPAA